MGLAPADIYQQVQHSSSSWHRGKTTTGFSVDSSNKYGGIQVLETGNGSTLFERMDHASVLSDR